MNASAQEVQVPVRDDDANEGTATATPSAAVDAQSGLPQLGAAVLGHAYCLHDLQVAVHKLPLYPIEEHRQQLHDLEEIVASMANDVDAEAVRQRATSSIARLRIRIETLVHWRDRLAGLHAGQQSSVRNEWIVAHRQRHGQSCSLPSMISSSVSFTRFLQKLAAGEREAAILLSRYLHSNSSVLGSVPSLAGS